MPHMVLMVLSAGSHQNQSVTRGGQPTLLGLYEAIEAVKTMEPFTFCLMKALAAFRAQ